MCYQDSKSVVLYNLRLPEVKSQGNKINSAPLFKSRSLDNPLDGGGCQWDIGKYH